MADKKEMVTQGEKQAELIINNALIDGLSAQLKKKQEYGLSFPRDYNPTNALMGAYLILKETTDKTGKCVLESCSQTSIANSLMDMVTMGLNVQKKQGYFIAYGGKCQFQKSYFGNETIARRYGMKSISAECIYKGDTFKYHIENAVKHIDEHVQDFASIDNDNIIGAYAVAIMNDGTVISEVMSLKQLKQAWSQKQGGYKEESYDTHVKFREEMSKKTVKNRLLKHIINTFGDSEVSEVYDKMEETESVDMVAADVRYEIDTQANSEDFVESEDNVVNGDFKEIQEVQQYEQVTIENAVNDKESASKTKSWMEQV